MNAEPTPARFSADALESFATDVVISLGTETTAARRVAEHLVGANLAGHDSHGLIRLPQYAEHAREGKVIPGAVPRTVRERPSTAVIDGGRGWGMIAAQRGIECAVEKAAAHSIAAVAVRNTHHIGRVGTYLMHAARAGFLAQAFCNAHGMRRAAPWGGTEARMATNPFAVAVPTRDETVVIDFATTAVAEGKVRLAKAKGDRIPEGWVLDPEGNPDTHPETLYNGGTLQPLGGSQGHKGFCLSLAMDIFGGLLGGSGAGTLTSEYGNGVLFQVLDPDAFCEREELLDRLDAYLEYVRSSAPAAGVERILLPGEPERLTAEHRRANGIEIDPDTQQKLEHLGQECGVTPPMPVAG